MRKLFPFTIILLFTCGNKNVKTGSPPDLNPENIPATIKRHPDHEYFEDFDELQLKGYGRMEDTLRYPFFEVWEEKEELIVIQHKDSSHYESRYQKKDDYYFAELFNYGTEGCSLGFEFWKDGAYYLWEFTSSRHHEKRPNDTCFSWFVYEDKYERKECFLDYYDNCNGGWRTMEMGPFIPKIDSSKINITESRKYTVKDTILEILTKEIYYNGNKTSSRDTHQCFYLEPPFYNPHSMLYYRSGNEVDCNTHQPLK